MISKLANLIDKGTAKIMNHDAKLSPLKVGLLILISPFILIILLASLLESGSDLIIDAIIWPFKTLIHKLRAQL